MPRMTDAKQIETELLDFLRREVFAPEVSLAPETNLITAGFDSMSLMRLLVFVETSYGIWLPQGEINADTLRDVRSLTAAVFRLLNEP